MAQFTIIKFKKVMAKLVCKANIANKTPGYELVYSVSDSSKISNLLVSGEGFTSYDYNWSFDQETSTITVRSTKSNKVTQTVKVGNIQELIDVMFEYSTKPKHRKIESYGG